MTEEDTFDKLRRISVREMDGIYSQWVVNRPNTAAGMRDREILFEKNGWTSEKFFEEWSKTLRG